MPVVNYDARRYDLASVMFVFDLQTHCYSSNVEVVKNTFASLCIKGKQFPMTKSETPETQDRVSTLLATSEQLKLRYERIIQPQKDAIEMPFKYVVTIPEDYWFSKLPVEYFNSYVLHSLGYCSLGRLASTCKRFRDLIRLESLVYARERFECKLVEPALTECQGKLRVLTYDEEYVTFYVISVAPQEEDGICIGLEYRDRYYIVGNDVLSKRTVEFKYGGTTEETEFKKFFVKLVNHPFDKTPDLLFWANVIQGSVDREIRVEWRMYGEFDEVIEKTHHGKDCVCEFNLACYPSKWAPSSHAY